MALRLIIDMAMLLCADCAGAGDILLLLCACFVPAVCDLLALDCLVW